MKKKKEMFTIDEKSKLKVYSIGIWNFRPYMTVLFTDSGHRS